MFLKYQAWIFSICSGYRESFLSVFMTLCHKHLAFASAYIFRLSTCLAELCPELIVECLPQLEDLVKTVERKRGVGYDPGLRLVHFNLLAETLNLN
jgi:hypothetical protein